MYRSGFRYAELAFHMADGTDGLCTWRFENPPDAEPLDVSEQELRADPVRTTSAALSKYDARVKRITFRLEP